MIQKEENKINPKLNSLKNIIEQKENKNSNTDKIIQYNQFKIESIQENQINSPHSHFDPHRTIVDQQKAERGYKPFNHSTNNNKKLK